MVLVSVVPLGAAAPAPDVRSGPGALVVLESSASISSVVAEFPASGIGLVLLPYPSVVIPLNLLAESVSLRRAMVGYCVLPNNRQYAY